MRTFLATIAVVGLCGTAFAQSGSTIVSPPMVNNNALRMQIERNQIQTQTYQLQQKIYREQDRRNGMQRPSQPDVPVFRSTCTPTNGVPCR
jgi:hypothetical protein